MRRSAIALAAVLASTVSFGSLTYAADPGNNATPADQSAQQPPAPVTQAAPQPAPANQTAQQPPQANKAKVHKASAKASPSKRRIEEIQAGLDNKGENVPIDGIWGPKTRQSLIDFQKKNGLPASGRADKATLQKLNPPNWKS